ncbi:unnamed protein product [Dovyalis caffra]|uniref:Uncharacterized protein n=1 Tax=Dovyalis caffra TaxID=77055 RepID=A0AAV1R9T0_9ROSI|nr:unnamed protein product [Dovyalis caffra]
MEQTLSLGGCTVTIFAPGPDGPTVIDVKTGQALWLEIICGFVYLFVSVYMAFDHLLVSTTETAAKGYGGAGLNPAIDKRRSPLE